jgi:N-acetylmuramoyl-L-alanine amidase
MSWKDHIMAQRKSVVITAGHSSTQPGAVAHGFTESEIVTRFRDLVANCLRDRGASFAVDAKGDNHNLPLDEAIKLAQQADLAYEFHTNAATSPRASGVEVLAKAGDTEAIKRAHALSTVIAGVLKISNRGGKPDDAGAHSRLAFCQAGGLLVELFFLTNRGDLDRFLDRRMTLAEEVAKFILEEAQHAQPSA